MLVFLRLLFCLMGSAHVLAAPGLWPAAQTPLGNSGPGSRAVFPLPNNSALVQPVLKDLSIANMRETLTKYTAFPNRHHETPWGLIAQKWLYSKVIETAVVASHKYGLPDVEEMHHAKWAQNSIVARIRGSDPEAGVVILGAHLDSKNYQNPQGIAPGADDDGSGTVAILEVYRSLLAANFTPTRTVEFHWYAAEEGGALGSEEVARLYKGRDVNVVGQLQMDGLAWVMKGTREEMAIAIPHSDSGLISFVQALIETYCKLPWVTFTPPNSAGSDHMMWTRQGYPAAWVAEGTFEHMGTYIHTENDRIDISDEFSFEHMLEFAKLGVAYAIELGRWEQ
ncbi:Zn-dependent exopeptidase [Punctularia strigosozonata HHB-11173 SS5]|uniref:Zn-dependent exopeptidase n=1 Tax=Punctularia strigosozonata (strain HHB-11173) TaxID=741275 RepID=UPI00044175FE|nr:Zn-dependent exopeptidase [Punctularia strigosozonata HHB-11173 SS5]EIN07049.1 Zn-dependent exopeptidase [Punctularia strigosozonata HHB-11173 SS5]